MDRFIDRFGIDYLTMKLPDASPFSIEHKYPDKAVKVCLTLLRILMSLSHFPAGVEAIIQTPGTQI